MKDIKKFRIDKCYNEYKKCLYNLEQSFVEIDSKDIVLSELSKRAFFSDIKDIIFVLEDYVCYILLDNNYDASYIEIEDGFLECVKLEKINHNLLDNIKSCDSIYNMIRFENYIIYKEKYLNDFIAFYNISKQYLNNQYKLIEDEVMKYK